MKINKIFVLMFLAILLVGTVSADILTTHSYSEDDLKVEFRTLGLMKFGEATLTSHKNVEEIKQIMHGENRAVMWYDINFTNDKKNGLGKVYFTNMKTGKEIEKDYYFAEEIKVPYKSPIYEEECVESFNGTDCYNIVKGFETKYRIEWKKLSGLNISKGFKRIALITDINEGDYIDGVWTIAGEKITAHATWTSNFDDGLVAYYSFNDGTCDATSGNLEDVVTGQYNGTAVGGATNCGDNNVSGIIGDAFNASSDSAINLTDSVGAWGEISICVWSNIPVGQDHNALVNKFGDGTDLSFYLHRENSASGGTTYILYDGANVNYQTNEDPPVNQWVFNCIVGNSTANVVQGYENGVLNGSAGNFDNVLTDGNNGIYLGWYERSDIPYFNGLIDEVGIWNRTLTASEISDLYNGGVGLTYPIAGDDNPPSLTLVSPADSYNTPSTNIIFNWTVEDDSNVTNSTLYLGNGSIIEFLHGTSNYTSEQITIGGFAEGTHNWNVTAYDNISQLSSSANRAFTINFSLNNIILSSPVNDTETNNEPIEFNSSIEPYNINITNSTIQVYYSNGSLWKTNTTDLNNGTDINVSSYIGGWSGGNYYWNNYVCFENNLTGVFEYCLYSDNNNTLSWIPFQVDAEYEIDPVIETSYQTFYLNVTTEDGYTVQSANLIYNGTTYSNAIRTEIDSDSEELKKSIYIPKGTVIGFTNETRDFYWNVSITEEDSGVTNSYTSDTYNQTVSELPFSLCGSGYDVPVLNFTLKDEGDDSLINATSNATTFQATFNYGSNSLNLAKNYSINNLSTNVSTFDFCTANYTQSFYSDAEIFYTAVDYVDKDYYLNNANLTNLTNSINLYLLLETEALEFFISVTKDLDALIGVTINIAKYFTGEGVYKTVEIDETDGNGKITSYLDLDKKYRFTIIEDGGVLGIQDKDATCEAAPCEILLELTSEGDSAFEALENAFAQNVMYNLSFNQSNKFVTWDFIDTTGLATYFRMYVYRSFANQSGELIYDKTLYTSSGQITYNASNYSTGDFKVEIYVSRSPESFIDFITFLLNENAEELGVVGLLAGFMFMMVIIFGLAMKPSILVLSVPLGLSLIKLMGLFSASTTSISVLWVLAIIAVWVMNK